MTRPTARRVDVAIIGAGMSGICMAATLKRAGIDSFTILEKATDVGGTWRENSYPGLTCDVPSPFYSYSFAPNPRWTHRFASGTEIHRYLRDVFDRADLAEHTRFGFEIADATHLDGRWVLSSVDGRQVEADVVVAATGVLHHPRYPDLPGRDSFAGRCFHSARWDHDVDVEGKRVGVLGTGSTGVQIVTALAPRAAHVTQFQRTPQWVIPLPNQRYPRPLQAVVAATPLASKVIRRAHQATFEFASVALLRPGARRTAIQTLARANLRRVRDPELRDRLKPTYQPGCKRLVVSAGYYSAVQRSNVEVVGTRLIEVRPEGVVTEDGRLHELDVLVLATGFDAQAYVRPMDVQGPTGATLADAWRDGPTAHLTVGVPGLPNFFLLMGPNSPIGNTSLVPVAEVQSNLVLRFVRSIQRGEVTSVEARSDALEEFQSRIRRDLGSTVWVTGCDSWYLGADGTPNLWPWSFARFRRQLERPRVSDWVLT